MKKIIGIIFISLMFCNIGFAEMRLMETKKISAGSNAPDYIVSKICIDTHIFILTSRAGSTNMSMVQFMKMDRNYGVTIVGRCKKG